MKKQTSVETATWELYVDPLYMVDCPHCEKTIIMSRPNIIQRLLKWGKAFKGVVR